MLECLASVVIALGAGFQEFAPPVFQRALRVLEMTLVAHTTATQEKRDFPDTELIVCSLDLIGGLLESLQSAMLDLVRQSNLVTLAVQCLNVYCLPLLSEIFSFLLLMCDKAPQQLWVTFPNGASRQFRVLCHRLCLYWLQILFLVSQT